MADLVEIDFYGDTILARRTGPGPRDVEVSVRRVCENLGLHLETQLTKLKKAAWAICTDNRTVAEDGRMRAMTMISLRSVPMWLAGISEERVAGHVREKLVRYQLECADVLADHFMPRTVAPAAASIDLDSNDGLLVLASKLTDKLLATTKRAEEAEGKVLQLSANLEAAEVLVGEAADAVAFTSLVRADNEKDLPLTRAAGILQQKRNKFRDFMLNEGLVYRDRTTRDIVPKAQYKPRYFREKLYDYVDPKTGENKTSASLRITHEGIYWLAKKLGVTPDFDATEAAE